METGLIVKKEIENDICTLRVQGVLDYSTINPFIQQIQSIEAELSKVIVDFTDLEFIDSTGIGVIINLVHEALDKKFEVELDGINEDTRELFETIGVFQIMETLQQEEA